MKIMNTISDASKMLFLERDMTRCKIKKPLLVNQMKLGTILLELSIYYQAFYELSLQLIKNI